MLSNTFQHIKGISAKKERELWHAGILTWDDLEKTNNRQLSLFNASASDSTISSSIKALVEKDIEFFRKHLSPQEYYRIALSFPQKTLFLDIETTGLSKYYDIITLVGWSIGKDYGMYLQGESDELFRQVLEEAKVIVTFNGSIFDIPFLKQKLSYLKIPECHVDLRFLARRAGLSGGQKLIENMLGVKRQKNVSNVVGETAPLLWYKYCWGDVKALKQLILYNHADIEGMKIIFDEAVKRLLEKNETPASIKKSLYYFSKAKSKIKWENDASANNGISLKPYPGKPGPLVFLNDLEIISQSDKFRVVGIDLTGSEKRPSGWCLLEDGKAITSCLNTDEEIISESLKYKPNLISIDSPLSIPFGRITVDDNDPGRYIYGIMRWCERILKKRGVNVYPSLIPSMQKLTARGIRLATHFRSLGVPVIESYPGAAQDIMGIPRKGASLEYLSRGLELFGIQGDFTNKKISHDELDAITSALVGLFFWSGKFEALGNNDEDYLIIPNLHIDTTSWKLRKVIGISGPTSAGKTKAGRFLQSLGYAYGGYSATLKRLLADKKIKVNNKAIQIAGERMYKEPEQRWLCKQLIKVLPQQGNIIIDGLQYQEDHAFMVETFGPAFIHIYIDAPEKIREQRYTKKEISKAINQHPEANISKLSLLAHKIIHNDGDIMTFEQEILKSLNGIIRHQEEYSACL